MNQWDPPAQERPDDTRLWDCAAAGDAPAFGALFTRHSSAVYNHCLRRMDWSSAAAEDALSLVFLEAWRCRRRVVLSGGSLLPWLLGTATNVCRNVTRAARRYDACLFRLPPPDSEPDFGDAVAERLDDVALGQEISRAMAQLNRPQRDVVGLVLIDGLTYQEASIALGIPVGTVRSRVSRARRILENTLAVAVPSPAASGIAIAAGHAPGS